MNDWKLTRILCAVDLSPASFDVLSWAGLFASSFGAGIEVVHAVSFTAPPYITPSQFEALIGESNSLRAAATKQVADLVEKAAPGISAKIHVREGHPLEVIRKQISESKPDLVIMGSHGHSRLERVLLGSVTENLFREADVPVLVVRNAASAVKKILCPIRDNDVVANCTISSQLATKFGASLTVLSAIENEQMALSDVCSRVSQTLSGACKVDQQMVHGDSAEAIVQYAESNGSDLVVINSVRKKMLEEYVLGRTTVRVVRHAKTNVLVVPA
jgi:nucleotide-binding universal stress UspA family protein